MATSAVVSKGTTVKIKSGASTLTKIAGFKDFSGLFGGSSAVIDVTDLDSVSKEKLMGVSDEGSISLNFNYIAADAGQVIAFAARQANTLCQFEIATLTKKFAFDGYLMTAEVSGGVDQAVSLAVTVEITGTIVTTAVA